MLIAFVAAVLCACTAVEEIALIENGVKTEYSVDEEFPKDAKISVKYQGGRTETVNIGGGNVSGFDTSTSGTRTMTVNYGGKSLAVEYNVKGRVNTGARVTAEADFSEDSVKVTLRLSGLDTFGVSLYAIKIKTTYSADKLGDAVVRTTVDGWTVETVESAGTVSALFYDPNAEIPISADGAFAEITFGRVTSSDGTEIYFSGGSAGYDEIDASDGEELWFMPAFGIGYSVIED